MGLFGKITNRLDELRRVLTKDPGSRQFLALADEYRKHGQVAEAIETLQKGLATSPGSVAGHVALGRLLAQGGRLDEAVESFEAALRLDRENLVALRQLAEIHLKRGDKVEAIKKLKLYRGLSPGDRDVNDLIDRLDEELGWGGSKPGRAADGRSVSFRPPVAPLPFAGRPAPAPTPPAPPVPAAAGPPPALAAPPVEDLLAAPAAAVPPPPPVGPAITAPIPVRAMGPSDAEPFPVPALTAEAAPDAVPAAPREPFEITYDSSGAPWSSPFAAVPAPVEAKAAAREEVPAPTGATLVPEGPDEPLPGIARVPSPPLVSETLAELYASQGHLPEARDAYRSLADLERDGQRAGRLRERSDELDRALREEGPPGRLRRWADLFERARAPLRTDLDTALGELMERVEGIDAASVTDLEGFTVVYAGDSSATPALEGLSAELTAFWKNVRRTRGDVGEGALDCLAVTGERGTVLVQGITPSYALLLKAAAGRPQGQLRFEALRTAERLRPSLL